MTGRTRLLVLAAVCPVVVTAATVIHAQNVPPARVAVLQAEARGATEPRDLAALRAGIRSTDEQTARLALRVLGRLGRPGLVADITPSLKSSTPELRAEAAQAIASALSGSQPAVGAVAASATKSFLTTLNTALTSLLTRLQVEAEPLVRAAICEALARLPLSEAGQIARVEAALLGIVHSDVVTDRLGVVKGVETLIRTHAGRWAPSGETIAVLRELVGVDIDGRGETDASATGAVAGAARDARVRRLALEALTRSAHADSAVLQRASADGDWQVRRLAMKAAGVASGSGSEAAFEVLKLGLTDAHPMVRIESLRAESVRAPGTAITCAHLARSLDDTSPHVVLAAIDLLATCQSVPEGVSALERIAASSSAPSLRLGNRQERARQALMKGAPPSVSGPLAAAVHPIDRSAPDAGITAVDLARLASARARVRIQGLGSFDMTLLTAEAPATVVRFVRMVERGDFNGSAVGAVRPSSIGLAPVGPGTLTNLRNETGPWPHVRGALGLTFGNGTDGAGLFVDLVDAPAYDHVYPVFAHVLNGMDVIDQILEGDIIESIEIF